MWTSKEKLLKFKLKRVSAQQTCGRKGCSKRSSASGFFRNLIMLLGCSKVDPARTDNLPTQWSVTSAVSWWEHRISTLSAVGAQYIHWLFASGTHIAFVTRGADKSLARPISRCILFDGENISFDASLVIYINSTNIPPIMIINRIYETQNLLSL